MSNLKVRLRSGEAEIEIEGSRVDVDQLLERWWQATAAKSPSPSRPTGGSNAKRSSAQRTRNTSSSDPAEPAIDANTVANAVKESDHFEVIETKILHATGQVYNKIAFAIWFAEQPLTSGDIFRLLNALDVRISLPSVSNALKSNLKNLTTDKARKQGGAPPAYKLTSKARADFEKWLLAKSDDK